MEGLARLNQPISDQSQPRRASQLLREQRVRRQCLGRCCVESTSRKFAKGVPDVPRPLPFPPAPTAGISIRSSVSIGAPVPNGKGAGAPPPPLGTLMLG